LKTSTALDETADALHSLAVRLLRAVRIEDEATGLGAARLSALSVLVYGGPQTLGGLAAVERISLPTMTRIAAALTRLGYARREHMDGDRRYVRLTATDSGARLLKNGRERRVNRLAALLEGLSPGDRDICARAVQVLAGPLERNEPSS
jgi:DNA-binding MarR family transcriptional regulator